MSAPRALLHCVWLSAALGCSASPKRIAPGLYSGPAPGSPGLLQLVVNQDGSARFREVVTVHLPPAVVEDVAVRLERRAGRVCLVPVPAGLEACLGTVESGSVELVMAPGGGRVRLLRQPAAK